MPTAPEFGALPTGFVPKTTQDFLEEWTGDIRATVDPAFDVSPTEPMGQILAITAAAMSDREELIQTIYNAMNPNAAEGAYLAGTGAIIGVVPAAGETDAQFRVRREASLATGQGGGGGSSTLANIVAGLLEINGIVTATAYDNAKDAIDAQGRPPHSVEAVISDGITPAVSNDVIAQVLWDRRTDGIPFFSSTGDQGNAIDADGNAQVVPFSRVTFVEVYISATTTPTGNEAAIKAALATWGNALPPGATVYLRQMLPVFFGAGCVDVPSLTLGIAPSPAGTANLTPTPRQVFAFDTSRITLNGI